MIGRPKFVLASGSPRRLSLINQAGIEPDALRPAELDETPRKGELPRACANRLARAKAEAALATVRIDDELKWVGKALDDKDGVSAEVMEHYGDILYKLGNFEEALEYWLKAKAKGPGSLQLDKKITEKKLVE